MEHPHRPHLEQSYTASRWLPHTEPQFPLCTSFPQQGYIDSRKCCYTLGRIQLSIPPREQSQWQFLERWHTSAQGYRNIAHLEPCYIASWYPTRKKDFNRISRWTTTLGRGQISINENLRMKKICRLRSLEMGWYWKPQIFVNQRLRTIWNIYYLSSFAVFSELKSTLLTRNSLLDRPLGDLTFSFLNISTNSVWDIATLFLGHRLVCGLRDLVAHFLGNLSTYRFWWWSCPLNWRRVELKGQIRKGDNKNCW